MINTFDSNYSIQYALTAFHYHRDSQCYGHNMCKPMAKRAHNYSPSKILSPLRLGRAILVALTRRFMPTIFTFRFSGVHFRPSKKWWLPKC